MWFSMKVSCTLKLSQRHYQKSPLLSHKIIVHFCHYLYPHDLYYCFCFQVGIQIFHQLLEIDNPQNFQCEPFHFLNHILLPVLFILLQLLSNNIFECLVKRNMKRLNMTATTFNIICLSCLMHISNQIFPVDTVGGGCTNMFLHHSLLHFFIVTHSHQALSWNATCTLGSRDSCYSLLILNLFHKKYQQK